MLAKSVMLCVVLFLPLTRIATAQGEGQAVEDTVRIWKVKPSYSAGIKGDVTMMSMDHKFTNVFKHKNGVQFSSSISSSETKYRLQNRRDNSKSFSNSFSMLLKPGLLLSAMYSDSRVFNRIVTLSGTLQDFKINTKKAMSMLQLFKALPSGMRFDARSVISASSAEKVFKADKRLHAELGAGVYYSMADRVDFAGRAYFGATGERSETGFQNFGGLGEKADSMVTKIRIKLPSRTQFDVNYTRATKTHKYIDLPRGLYFEQKLGAEDLIREEEMNNFNSLSLSGSKKILEGIEFKMSAEHSVNLNDFSVTKKRFNRTVFDGLMANLTYNYGKKKANSLTFKTEKNTTLRDLGALSVSSYRKQQRSVSLMASHSFSNTFALSVIAVSRISQMFYLNFDVNPRDRDQMNQMLQVNLRSKPFSKTDASVILSISSTDFININNSLSSNNRKETTYDIRPGFIYHLNDRIDVEQKYGLNIEFTDYVFTENENFLDRSITFLNSLKARLSRALSVELQYELLLHDRGSYLLNEEGTERLLSIAEKDRKDRIQIAMRYVINEHLVAMAKHEYSKRRDRFVATGNETVFPDGTIEGGLKGKFSWGPSKELNFTVLKVNKFSTFNSRAQNDYWAVKSNVSYAF